MTATSTHRASSPVAADALAASAIVSRSDWVASSCRVPGGAAPPRGAWRGAGGLPAATPARTGAGGRAAGPRARGGGGRPAEGRAAGAGQTAAGGGREGGARAGGGRRLKTGPHECATAEV